MQQAQTILQNTFGYPAFRLNQADIVQALIDGQDVLALMPTGGGKSLCYQIPAIVREGTGVVVSPLIALMQDQVDALALLGVKAAFLNSSMDRQQVIETERALLQGELDLLYVAPERLVTSQCLNLLKQITISLFAIDEAHCVSQWGHDFRPEYQQLALLAQEFPGVPRVALTATADARTRSEIIDQLQLHQAAQFINSFDRPNIRYLMTEAQQSREQLWQFIQNEHSEDAGIVYCLSRKKVEATAEWLQKKGRKALPYHAGLSNDVRRENQQRFLRESGVIVVATIAFGMGIDKPDVRFVAHLSLPKSIEAYYQETGRAGRDGAPANAWMAYGLQDVITLRQMMEQSNGSDHYKRITQQKLDAMLGLCELISCRRKTLLAYFDESLTEPCGNCDNCLNPAETWDASVAAQKALSCVYRSGQRFGVAYIVSILLGKLEDRIEKNGHDKLSTFGVGQELSVFEWRSLFRQLIASGLIRVDHDRYGALTLSEECRPLLKGQAQLLARKFVKAEKANSKSGKSATKSKAKSLSLLQQPLFDALKTLRSQLADNQGVPAYYIFSDACLLEMTQRRPTNETQMQCISGVGEYKLAQYGSDFLSVIGEHPLPALLDNDLSDTVNDSLLLFSEGKTVADIAASRELNENTIYGHLAEAIKAGLLDPCQSLSIDDSQYQLIAQSLHAVETQTGRLKTVFEDLDGEFSYGIIRCVAAAEFAQQG